MQKNNNKNIKKVDKYTAKMRIIGGVICLVALITAFLVGLFVGKSIKNNKEDIQCSNDIVLTADNTYQLGGFWQITEYSIYTTNLYNMGGYSINFTCNGVSYIGFNSSRSSYISGGSNGYRYNLEYKTSNGNIVVSTFSNWACIVNEPYRVIDFGENQNVSSEFYNWFTAVAMVYVPPVTTYNITYNFNNIIYNGYELPSTVDDDSNYSLKFLTNGIEGFFPLEDYIFINAVNCDIINITYGLDYYPVEGMQYNLIVDISNISGNVVLDFSGESIIDNSSVFYTYSNINSFELIAYNMVNCNVWKYQDNFIVYPLELNNQYSFILNISSYAFEVSTPTVNIINGGGSVVYDYFKKNETDNNIYYSSNFIIRPNDKGVIIQLRVFTADYSAFDELDTSFVSWLGTAVGGFFDFYIMPGLSLGVILGSIVMIGFVIWVIRVFMGG